MIPVLLQLLNDFLLLFVQPILEFLTHNGSDNGQAQDEGVNFIFGHLLECYVNGGLLFNSLFLGLHACSLVSLLIRKNKTIE